MRSQIKEIPNGRQKKQYENYARPASGTEFINFDGLVKFERIDEKNDADCEPNTRFNHMRSRQITHNRLPATLGHIVVENQNSSEP